MVSSNVRPNTKLNGRFLFDDPKQNRAQSFFLQDTLRIRRFPMGGSPFGNARIDKGFQVSEWHAILEEEAGH